MSCCHILIYVLNSIDRANYVKIELWKKTYKLIEALPVVLRHESKGTEQRPAEVIEVCVAVVRVRTSDNARIIVRALTARQTGPREHNFTHHQ